MRDAGMRYMIFTTKHHDGFCMFNTRQTDFSIASTPFGEEDGRDITAEVLRAFREQGFMTGTYFSKPDWSCPYTGGTSMPHPTAGSTITFPAIPGLYLGADTRADVAVRAGGYPVAGRRLGSCT